ncbi:MAG TPA: hydroxyacid dehydrogenase, partial [Lachnospiraceae bacterium]|nr:hydroxyacid dehydrogenase [Lachnospiraceae bacterium]
ENWIAGAGLDVLKEEPMAPDNPLFLIKDSTKLIITPHIAWATVEARQRVVDEVYQNIEAFQKGKVRNIVTQ